MNKNLILIFIAFLVFQTHIFAQEKVENKKTKKADKTLVPYSTQVGNNKIEFKNSIGNAIITITDEGNNAGSITFPQSTPSTTTYKLYNEGGILKFNGSAIGSGGGADSINQLVDAKYDGSSLFMGAGAGDADDGTNNYNTGVGVLALQNNISGIYNTAFGFYSLLRNTTGGYNTASGYNSLYFNTTGYRNTAYGYRALNNNTEASDNTAIGSSALYSNITGNYNTAVGSSALYNNTGSQNIAIGLRALFNNTNGISNIANGNNALYANTTGGYNIANGSLAMFENTTGSYNVGVGYHANYGNQQGSNNTIIGYQAGGINSTHNKSGSVFLGYKAGYNEVTDNKLYIENSNSSDPLIYGDFTDGSEKVKINGDFEVTKKTQIGTSGVPITEIKLLTGSLSTSLFVTEIPYPTGYNQSNTFLVSCKVGPPSGSGAIWENVGTYTSGDDRSLSVSFSDTQILLYRKNSSTSAIDYKMVIMKIE